jgi:hypothetical protein
MNEKKFMMYENLERNIKASKKIFETAFEEYKNNFTDQDISDTEKMIDSLNKTITACECIAFIELMKKENQNEPI